MTSAAVALPPRKPYRSASTTRAPASAAPSAAPRPAGPPPTTSTSASAASCARRGGSSIIAGFSGRASGGIATAGLRRQRRGLLAARGVFLLCAVARYRLRLERLQQLAKHRVRPLRALLERRN